MLELSLGVGACGRRPLRVRRPRLRGLGVGIKRRKVVKEGVVDKVVDKLRARGLGVVGGPISSQIRLLGGRGAGGTLKWKFIVFLKENIGFSMAGELPEGPGRGGWAPSGALGDASGSSLGAVGRVLGARGSVRGAPREVFGAIGSSFRRSGDNFG